MDQSQYLAQALRTMQEAPAAQPQLNQQAMGLGRMQPGQMGQPDQPQDPSAPRPSIGANLQQAWQNVQGAPQRVQSSIMNLGQLVR